jgi:hypothetical protein
VDTSPRRFPPPWSIEELDGLSMTKAENEHSEMVELLKTAHKGDAAASVFAGVILISLFATLALVLWLIKTFL